MLEEQTIFSLVSLQFQPVVFDLLVLLNICFCFCFCESKDTSHELAVKYNDQSVLENMHIAKALELTNEVACNIFEQFSADSVKDIRSVWITMILGREKQFVSTTTKRVKVFYSP